MDPEDRSTWERPTPSFDEFAEFVRDWAGLSKRKQITRETFFEDNLGITGDDGCELLEATEKKFGVCLSSPVDGYRTTFGLAPHEVLFQSEGLGWGLTDILSLFRPSVVPTSVRVFSVGELFEAVKRAPKKQFVRRSVLGLDA